MRDEIYRPTPDGASGDADDHPREQQAVAPDAALTWRASKERNRLLAAWRREVQIHHGEHTRALRVAWVLENLFNVKTGFAFASNKYLADATGMEPRDVQKGLERLDGDAIVRRIKRGRVTSRMIWPRRMEGVSTMDVPRHVHDADMHNLRRRTPRAPRTALAAAAASADLRERRTRERAADAAGAAAPDAARCAAEGVGEAEPAEAKAHPLTRKITAACRLAPWMSAWR